LQDKYAIVTFAAKGFADDAMMKEMRFSNGSRALWRR
jgi:hypothetical protein